ERTDVGELDDLIEAPLDFRSLHVQDRAVEEDVLAAGELRVEAGADLEQRAHPAAESCMPGGGRRDPGEDLQQRALTGAIVADHAERLALRNLEVDLTQCPEIACLGAPTPSAESFGDLLGEQHVAASGGADLEPLAEIPDLDGDVGAHMTSAKKSSARR